MSENSKESDNYESQIFGIIAASITLFVVAAWCCNLMLNLEGSFGDKFGVVNSLFSGLAFVAIAVTLFLQMKASAIQREELIEQRKENRLARIEAEKSNENHQKKLRLDMTISLYEHWEKLNSDFKEREKTNNLPKN